MFGLPVHHVSSAALVEGNLMIVVPAEVRLLTYRLKKVLPDPVLPLSSDARIVRTEPGCPVHIVSNPSIAKIKMHAASSHALLRCKWSAMSKDGRLLITGGHWDNSVLVHSLSAKDGKVGAVAQKLVGHSDTVTCVELAMGNRYVITGSMDCTVRIWRRIGDKQILATPEAVLHGHLSPVTSLVSDASLGVVASVSDDVVLIHSILTGKFIRSIVAPAPISRLCLTSMGTLILVCESISNVVVATVNGLVRANLPLPDHRSVTSLTPHNRKEVIIAGHSDGTVEVRSAWDYSHLVQLSAPDTVNGAIASVLVSERDSIVLAVHDNAAFKALPYR